MSGKRKFPTGKSGSTNTPAKAEGDNLGHVKKKVKKTLSPEKTDNTRCKYIRPLCRT